jgi:hypothetical protein
MCAGNSPLIVAIEDGRALLGEPKFIKEQAQPDDLASTMGAKDVLSLTGRQHDNALLL